MAKRKLFGTDGIRGKANCYPMTGEVAMALGRAVVQHFQRKNKGGQPLIIIGKDTRLSCYMLEGAFASGVCSQGGRAILTGPLPTPGVAFVTESMRADAGVMISASHNPFYDNGIKIFDHLGNKLPDEVEEKLEELILNPELIRPKFEGDLGRVKRLDEVVGRYVVKVKSAYPSHLSLEGMRIVVDCAHGAAYRVAPLVFEELGAEVISLGVSPNGKNINDEVGALYPKNCAEAVQRYRADLGICLDGDADRLILIDENGDIVDGDKVIGMLAKYKNQAGLLGPSKAVVGTVMSNLGLENFLKDQGIGFERTKVGDRYILERMNEMGGVFGGEPSGHIIFKKYSTTGDGILSALKVLEVKKQTTKSVSQLAKEVVLYPQRLINVGVASKPPFEKNKNISQTLKEIENEMGKEGRVLLRYSGTENKARVMVEGKNIDQVNDCCEKLAEVVKRELS
jgi:phosphoglucosamine mutase